MVFLSSREGTLNQTKNANLYILFRALSCSHWTLNAARRSWLQHSGSRMKTNYIQEMNHTEWTVHSCNTRLYNMLCFVCNAVLKIKGISKDRVPRTEKLPGYVYSESLLLHIVLHTFSTAKLLHTLIAYAHFHTPRSTLLTSTPLFQSTLFVKALEATQTAQKILIAGPTSPFFVCKFGFSVSTLFLFRRYAPELLSCVKRWGTFSRDAYSGFGIFRKRKDAFWPKISRPNTSCRYFSTGRTQGGY